MSEHIITVAPDNRGDYTTITEALAFADSLPPDTPVTLKLKGGIYKERLIIRRPYLTFEGISKNAADTVITYGLSAFMEMEDGSKRGTFRSYSVLIDTHDFTAKNITFENSSGDGRQVGQALAVYAEGDMLCFDNCRFLGCQDTVFTGPLPPKELKPGGFVGPKQFAPRINGRQYYKDCYIRGDVDFIFGSATAYFENCEIFSNCRDMDINGYVTAPSTPKDQEYGYVFEHCRFTSDCPPRTVYLGRPWRDYARAVFLNCELGAHIRCEGFHDWNKEITHETAFWAEYNSTGEGASGPRVPWAHQLTGQEAAHYSRKNVLGF